MKCLNGIIKIFSNKYCLLSVMLMGFYFVYSQSNSPMCRKNQIDRVNSDMWKSESFGRFDSEKEIKDKRSISTKYFKNEDGTLSAFMAAGPIHYFEDGKWKTIYHSIEPSVQGFQNIHNSIKTYYPFQLGNEGITTVLENGLIFKDLQQMQMYFEVNGQKVGEIVPNTSKGEASNNILNYKDVYGSDIDVRLTQHTLKRKLDYLIQSKSAITPYPSTGNYMVFKEVVTIPEGITAELNNNLILFKDLKGNIIAQCEKPIIRDTREIVKNNSKVKDKPKEFIKNKNFIEGEYFITQSGQDVTILTKVSLEWLNSSDRVFPIVVDPTVYYYPTNTSNWTGYEYSNVDAKNSGDPHIGSYTTGVTFRGWAKFDISGISDAATITDVDIYTYENYNYAVDIDISYTQLTTEPVAQSANGLNTAINSGTTYSSLSDAPGYEDGTGWYSKDLGATADSYLQGTSLAVDWFAVGFKCTYYAYDDDYVYIDGYSSSNKPYILVTFTGAASLTWEGDVSGNWATAGNWNGNVVPSSTDNVTIPSGTPNSCTISASTAASCLNLTINSGATLTDGTLLASGGGFTIYGNFANNGTYTRSGDLYTAMYGSSKTLGGTGTFNSGSIEIVSGASITLSSNTTLQYLYLDNSATAVLNLSSYYLTVTADFNQEGTINFNSGTLEMNGYVTNPNASRWNCGTGLFYEKIAFSGTWPTGFTFYDFRVDCSGYTYSLTTSTTIGNNLTVTAGTLAVGTSTITVAGTTANTGTISISSGVFDANGMFDATGGAVTFTGAGNLYLGSTVTSLGTFTESTSTVTYDGAGQNVMADTYYNLVMAGSGTKTAQGTINVSNNFTLNGTSTYAVGTTTTTVTGTSDINTTVTISTGTFDANGTFDATGGNVTFTGAGNLYLGGATVTSLGTLTTTAGTVHYDRAGAQTVLLDNYYNLTIATSGTKTLGGSIDVDGNLTISAGTLDVSATPYNINLAGNWSNGGTFTYQTGTVTFDGTSTVSGASTTTFYNVVISGTLTGHSSTMNIYNNYTNNGTFTHNSGTVGFTGNAAQTLGGSNSSTFYRLTMNNSSATGVSLGVNTTINNQITLTDGLLYTVSYTLTLGTNASNATVPSGSSTSYIVAYNNAGTIGYVKQFVNTAASTSYNFPIGEATKFTPLTFTLVSAGGLASANLIIHTKGASITGMNAGITQYIARQWVVTESGFTTPTYNINYIYDDADIVGTETGLLPIKLSGVTWYKPTGSSFTDGTEQGTGSVNTGTNTLTWNSLTTFSLFGGAVDGAVVLPVTLHGFSISNFNGNVKLNWKTSSEINNDHFDIERSDDGENFEFVNQVKGAGNSNYPISYFMIDENYYKGINYYRLIMVDFNDSTTVSPVLSIDMSNKSEGVKIMTVNSIGQEVNESFKGVVFDIYSDGSSVKRIQ